MEPGDLEEVKSLHEQCFPVRYDMVSTRRRFFVSSYKNVRKSARKCTHENRSYLRRESNRGPEEAL